MKIPHEQLERGSGHIRTCQDAMLQKNSVNANIQGLKMALAQPLKEELIDHSSWSMLHEFFGHEHMHTAGIRVLDSTSHETCEPEHALNSSHSNTP